MMDQSKKHLTVVAALIEISDKIVISQRYDHDAFGSLWEFPGGTVEEGETLTQALQREIDEELGVNISVGELVSVFEDENETLKITVHLFRCSIIKGRLSPLDCQEIRLYPLACLRELNLAPVDKKILNFLSS